MQIVVSNKSKLTNSPNRITVRNMNNVGRVTFGKISKLSAASVGLEALNNVVITDQKDGDVLVYQANTSTYNIKTLPRIDGGEF